MHHCHAAFAEKSRKRYRRNQDGVPGEEITCLIEWRKERHAEATIGHGIQNPVACRGKKEIQPQPTAAQTRQRARKSRHKSERRDNAGKEQRVGESAMSPKVTVTNTEPKSGHVDVGQYRARCANGPHPLWNFRPSENGSNSKCCYCV
jgi:hypothetical protein